MVKYKIVTVMEKAKPDDKNIYTGFIIRYGLYAVKYKLNEWVQAPKAMAEHGNYLTVFNNPHNLYQFVKGIGIIGITGNLLIKSVFKCKVKGRHKTKALPPLFFTQWVNSGLSYKRMEVYNTFEPLLSFFPDGTEMWEYVKLIERIPIDEMKQKEK